MNDKKLITSKGVHIPVFLYSLISFKKNHFLSVRHISYFKFHFLKIFHWILSFLIIKSPSLIRISDLAYKYLITPLSSIVLSPFNLFLFLPEKFPHSHCCAFFMLFRNRASPEQVFDLVYDGCELYTH